MVDFKLTPPDALEPVSVEKAAQATLVLSPSRAAKIDVQREEFLKSLMHANVQSDAFRSSLDKAFSVGRHEIAQATNVSNKLTDSRLTGDITKPAAKAISELRTLFDDLNPGGQGDLLAPSKFLGIPIPFANKLKGYLRKYEAAGSQIAKLHEQVIAAKDDVAKSVATLGEAQRQLWSALENLEAAEYFMTTLDAALTEHVESLKFSDSVRAKALEQEVLYYVRANVNDVLTAKALTINAYEVAGQLRKTGREVINGCDRVATIGMSALSVAVLLAQSIGVQTSTLNTLVASKKSIEDIIAWTGTALNQHVKDVTQFAANPLLGVETLTKMFEQTYQSIDMMEKFQQESMTVMAQNNTMLRQQTGQMMQRLTQERVAASAVPEGIQL